jgi:hypothetical protein
MCNHLNHKSPLFKPLAADAKAPSRLFKAVLASDEDALIGALLAGEDVNGRGIFELTPLHAACRMYGMQAAHGFRQAPKAELIIRELLAAGADATLTDAAGNLPSAWCEGDTPACLRNHMEHLAAKGTWPATNPNGAYEEDEERPVVRMKRRWDFVPKARIHA